MRAFACACTRCLALDFDACLCPDLFPWGTVTVAEAAADEAADDEPDATTDNAQLSITAGCVVAIAREPTEASDALFELIFVTQPPYTLSAALKNDAFTCWNPKSKKMVGETYKRGTCVLGGHWVQPFGWGKETLYELWDEAWRAAGKFDGRKPWKNVPDVVVEFSYVHCSGVVLEEVGKAAAGQADDRRPPRPLLPPACRFTGQAR